MWDYPYPIGAGASKFFSQSDVGLPVEKTSLFSGVALRFSVQSRTRKMDLKNQIHRTPSYRIEIYIILVSLMGKMSLRNLRGQPPLKPGRRRLPVPKKRN
jgi:hypothetical protein